MRHSTIRAALLISVVLHAGLFGWLASRPSPGSSPRVSVPIDVWLEVEVHPTPSEPAVAPIAPIALGTPPPKELRRRPPDRARDLRREPEEPADSARIADSARFADEALADESITTAEASAPGEPADRNRASGSSDSPTAPADQDASEDPGPLEPSSSAEALASGAPGSPEAPEAPLMPRRGAPSASLFPRLELFPQGQLAVPSGRGRTIRPDDPGLSAEALAAEAEHRVQGRVSGFLEDSLAEARAQNGLPHPYFTGVGEAARSALEAEARAQKRGPTLGAVAASFAQRYREATESYGKSGNPDLGPVGDTPRLSEQLQERIGSEKDLLFLRGLVAATELSEALKHGRPMLSLTLELRQSRSSDERSAVLLKGSGNAGFDTFVLGTWSTAIDQVGPPPAEAFRNSELRSVWEVEGWLRLSKKLETALSYLPAPGVLGVPLDRVLPRLTDDGYRYEFRARLLRVY